MDQFNINDELQAAMYDVAKLISNDEQQAKQLVDIFKEKVNVKFTNGVISGTSHAAGTQPHIRFVEENGEFKRICDSIEVTLQQVRYPLNINHYRIDIRHEFFHAFANLFNDDLVKLDFEKGLMSSNVGGKINERSMQNIQNQKDSAASVLFNEIVTDISAYCSYYSKENIGMEEILNEDGLEQINRRYGMGNGYRQLFPLGLCIIKAFSNYDCNYDELQRNIYEARYPSTDDEKVYYNDLLHGVLYNPLSIKEMFIKYTSEEDWNRLEQVSERIINNHKANRTTNYGDICSCLNLIANFLNKKYEKINDPTLKENLNKIKREFNILYNRAIEHYIAIEINQNER